jgi:hypothetical protein
MKESQVCVSGPAMGCDFIFQWAAIFFQWAADFFLFQPSQTGQGRGMKMSH